MTLREFLNPIWGGSQADKCLAVLYYHKLRDAPSLTVDQIRKNLISARVPNASRINVADALSKSGQLVDRPGLADGSRSWQLTASGEKYVRGKLNIPTSDSEIENDVATLESLGTRITDAVARDYVLEAIKCLSVGALRAAVVFLWTGAMRTLQQEAFKDLQLNAVILKHDPKARNVNKVDDFSYIRDATALLAFQDLGILDKGQKTTMGEALDLRNRCGHPTNYKPGVKKASSFIEDVVGIVFA